MNILFAMVVNRGASYLLRRRFANATNNLHAICRKLHLPLPAFLLHAFCHVFAYVRLESLILSSPIRYQKRLWSKVFVLQTRCANDSSHPGTNTTTISFKIPVLGNNCDCLYVLFINTLLRLCRVSRLRRVLTRSAVLNALRVCSHQSRMNTFLCVQTQPLLEVSITSTGNLLGCKANHIFWRSVK